jgi:RNA polymerase sigma-70 factor (ECF subfamily)
VQEEKELVHRAQQRDPEAFNQLYEANFDRIYRYLALKLGDRTEAEDLTQQVFLKALESIGSYNWRGMPFCSWLFRIAHNQAVDHFRKRGKQRSVPLDEGRTVAGDDPALLVEQRITVERLTLACKRLTGAQQEVVSLRFAGGLSIAEVAKAMGKNEGAIKALQHSAILALRQILSVSAEE